MKRYINPLFAAICLVIIAISCTDSKKSEETPIKELETVKVDDDIIKEVWIDADLAVGMKRYHRPGFSDVDDGYAILQLMKSNKVHINGISAVFGNTKIDDAFRLCLKMSSDFAPYEIPVYKGAGTAIDLSKVETNDGVEAMAASLKKQKMVIAAIGPATNVGILLLKYPELKSQIIEVVLVAGRRKPTDYFDIGTMGARAKDLNFDLDNTAFRVMLESKVNVTLCPFEISSKVWLKADDLEKLNTTAKGNKWLTEASQPWLAQWIAQGAEGFNPFDVLASHYIIAPDDIVFEDRNARLQIHSDDTVKDNEKGSFKSYLLCDEGEGTRVRYCYDVVPNYHELLIKSLK